jgi:DNA-binding SARP family transcriptional activator
MRLPANPAAGWIKLKPGPEQAPIPGEATMTCACPADRRSATVTTDAQAAPTRTLAAKIVPPVVPQSYLPRPVLLGRLDGALARRLTTIVAGAGFGKTTLLGSWVGRTTCAWYSVTADDGALAAIGRGIVQALRPSLRRVPEALLAAVQGLQGPDAELDELWRAQAVGGLLCDALADALTDDDLVLILDDLHELGESRAAARLVETLCREGPRRFHLVVSSRQAPPFPIERLRGQGQVLELGAPELAFALEETAGLLADALEDGAELAEELQRATGGWPAAVRLALEALRLVPGPERLEALAQIGKPEGPLFDYLAGEVYEREPPEVRRLIRAVAPLDSVSGELCEALGMEESSTTLASLARQGLFSERREGQSAWFSASELMREFARRHDPLSRADLRLICRRASEWFVARGQSIDALRALMSGGDQQAVARFLREHGHALLRAGAIADVASAAATLPPSLRAAEIDELEGAARQIRGDWEGALACFGRIAPPDGELAPGLAWRMGMVHHLRGRLDEALATYGRGRLGGDEPCDEALLLAWMASAHWLRGEAEACRDEAERAAEIASAAGDPQALAAAHTALALVAALEGDRAANAAHYQRAVEYAERAGDLLQLIRIRTNRASHYLEEGFYEETIGELEPAIGLAEVTGFAAWLGLGLTNRSEAHFHLGQLEEAIADLRAAEVAYERSGSRMLSYPLANLGDIRRERGELALARAAYEEAISLAEQAGDVQGLVPALAGLARVLVREEPAEAARLAEQALAHGTGMDYVKAALAAASVALEAGDCTRAAEYATEAAAMARARRDRAGLAEALEVKAVSSDPPLLALLQEARAIWHELGDPLGQARAELRLARVLPGSEARELAQGALQRLQGLGLRGYAAEAAAVLGSLDQRALPPLAIHTLGTFRVLRAGAPVPLTDWQSRKARDVLKILVARRGRPVPREELMETLWPDEDPKRVANRLSVALATIRSVLDPEKRVEPDYYVATVSGAVRLDLEHVVVDVETFLGDAEQGLAFHRQGGGDQARACLERAERAYAGEFLEEDAYEDWATPLREEAQALYVAVARALADVAVAEGDDDAAVRYLLRILERDPYDEPANLGLVAAMLNAGRHGGARRFFHAYCARMQRIGVEPAPFPDVGPAGRSTG